MSKQPVEGLSMVDHAWATLLTAAVGGGVTVKLLDIVYLEARAWFSRRKTDEETIDFKLRPFLRASDELSGKLRSLAEQDFLPIRELNSADLNDTRFSSVVYLFVQFWSELETVRFRELSATIARTKRGQQTKAFIDCLESKKVRLIDRISQRALGEAALANGRTMNFVEFTKSCDADPYMTKWLEPIVSNLQNLNESNARQRMLQYAAVIHSLIDTIDNEHRVTKDRPATPNKLSAKSWKDLNYRVFAVYLPFVEGRQKYIGPPKRRP